MRKCFQNNAKTTSKINDKSMKFQNLRFLPNEPKTKPKCEPKRPKWSQKRAIGSQKVAERVTKGAEKGATSSHKGAKGRAKCIQHLMFGKHLQKYANRRDPTTFFGRHFRSYFPSKILKNNTSGAQSRKKDQLNIYAKIDAEGGAAEQSTSCWRAVVLQKGELPKTGQ